MAHAGDLELVLAPAWCAVTGPVSVIMPAYNQARFIGRAIDSVLAQGIEGLELIVVDDGSTDETATVVKTFGEPVVYLHQENAGPATARNTALGVARGSLIALLDADDEFSPRFLERMIAATEREPGSAVFAGSWDEIDVNGAVIGHADAAGFPADVFHALFDPMRVGPPCRFLLRREALERAGGFDVAMIGCEDWDVWMRVAASGGHFAAVPDARVRYRVHPNGRSKDYTMMWKSGNHLLNKAVRYHGSCPCCRQARRYGLGRWREWCYVSMLAPAIRREIGDRRYMRAGQRAARATAADPRIVKLLLRSALTRSKAIGRAATQ